VDHAAQRRSQLTSAIAREQLDGLLITNPINVTYLTGFSGDSSYLVLGRGQPLLVSDARFMTQIQEECPGLACHIRPSGQAIPLAAAEMLNKLELHSVGFESLHASVAEWETLREQAPAIDWKPTRDLVESLRVIKDASEVTQIREAIHIAERAFAAFRVMLQPRDCEKLLCDRLEEYVRRFGGCTTSFPSIVAAGERAALPHAPPTANRVDGAQLLLVDWGAAGRFYKSDLTRVLLGRKNSAFSGSAQREAADPKLQTVYATVLRAQETALRLLRPGVRAREVDAAARSVIEEAGFGGSFGHGLGHGLGLEVHEAPAVRSNSEVVLQAGMVLTIEPGIYLPGWGGVRIEDDVLITPDGCEVLSSLPKDLGSMMCDF
jgi:Xaa-Pro aminopeptidase